MIRGLKEKMLLNELGIYMARHMQCCLREQRTMSGNSNGKPCRLGLVTLQCKAET